MMRITPRSFLLTLAAVALMALSAQTSLAGPPLICHAIEIGNAPSLPWEDAQMWRAVKKDYDPQRLVGDTLSLLTTETPVIVRMETLRRATVYAIWTLNDHKVGYSIKNLDQAQDLLARLSERVKATRGKGMRAESLALFDLGYLAEAYRQATISESPNPAKDINGYSLVTRAISLQDDDPEMEFAAALMTMGADKPATHSAHLKKAVAGATKDLLLARNINARFGSVANGTASPKTSPLSPASTLGLAVTPLIGVAAITGVWRIRQ